MTDYSCESIKNNLALRIKADSLLYLLSQKYQSCHKFGDVDIDLSVKEEHLSALFWLFWHKKEIRIEFVVNKDEEYLLVALAVHNKWIETLNNFVKKGIDITVYKKSLIPIRTMFGSFSNECQHTILTLLEGNRKFTNQFRSRILSDWLVGTIYNDVVARIVGYGIDLVVKKKDKSKNLFDDTMIVSSLPLVSYLIKHCHLDTVFQIADLCGKDLLKNDVTDVFINQKFVDNKIVINNYTKLLDSELIDYEKVKQTDKFERMLKRCDHYPGFVAKMIEKGIYSNINTYQVARFLKIHIQHTPFHKHLKLFYIRGFKFNYTHTTIICRVSRSTSVVLSKDQQKYLDTVIWDDREHKMYPRKDKQLVNTVLMLQKRNTDIMYIPIEILFMIFRKAIKN